MAGRRINAIDCAVGARIRLARLEAGLSQEKLAESLGVTFQQLQKYENGSNRCSPGKLLPISKVTGKPISWFFAEIEKKPDASTDLVTQMLNAPHGIEIAKSFLRIDDNAHRIAIARVVAAMAA